MANVEPARLAEHRGGFLDERLGQVSDLASSLEPPDELGRRRHADVGRDQRLLEALPGLVVGRVERGGGELVGQRAPALAERVPQAAEETRLGGLLLRRLGVAE